MAAYLGVKKGGLISPGKRILPEWKKQERCSTPSAYMFALSGDYLIQREIFSIGAGIDYLSGHDQKK
ncbi:MAG: hypothetical protein MZU84_01660 [Sphingobacterium sp.]|nr:hypothetical protein [Sphingobacterium sp.]